MRIKKKQITDAILKTILQTSELIKKAEISGGLKKETLKDLAQEYINSLEDSNDKETNSNRIKSNKYSKY